MQGVNDFNKLGGHSSSPFSLPDLSEKEKFLSLFRTAVTGAIIGGVAGVAVALIIAGTVTVLPLVIGGTVGLTALVALWLIKSGGNKEDLSSLINRLTPFGFDNFRHADEMKEIIFKALNDQELSAYDIDNLHYYINTLIDKIEAHQKKPFETFLKMIDGLKVQHENDGIVTLNFSKELERLAKKDFNSSSKKVDHFSDPRFERFGDINPAKVFEQEFGKESDNFQKVNLYDSDSED